LLWQPWLCLFWEMAVAFNCFIMLTVSHPKRFM
jgi:hypothetical protein